jgi:iron complex transport system substrate-binding protein
MRRWLLIVLWSLALHAQALQVTDDRGVAVDLPQAPQRIVSLLPSLTEMVCELGACDRLVGVDNYSNWPASVHKLPRVGGLEDANIEFIVSLRPDVVLLSVSRWSPRPWGTCSG